MAVGDSFASPVVLAATSGTAGIDNTGATYETDEPSNATGADGAVSVWYEWTLPANGGLGWTAIDLDTDATPVQTGGKQFDSTLEVFTGSTIDALTLLASNDDIDYPTNVHSQIHLASSFADGDVLRIRVDAWAPYDTSVIDQVANGVLTFAATPALPPAPTLTSVDLLAQKIGQPIVLTGSGFTTATAVTFGGVSTSTFTIDDDTHISLNVPYGALSDEVTVSNPGGTSGPVTFYPLYEGPWIQPADTWTGAIVGTITEGQRWVATWHGSSWGATYPDDTYDPSTVVGGSGGGWEVKQTSEAAASFGEDWQVTVDTETAVVAILGPINGAPDTYLAPVDPPPADLAPADVYDYEFESTHGDTIGPVQVTFGDNVGVSVFGAYEQSISSGTPADFADIADSDVHARRLTLDDYTLDGSGAYALTRWLTGTRLSELEDLADFAVAGTFSSSTQGGTDLATNISEVQQADDTSRTVTITTADLDGTLGSFAVAFASDPLLNDTYPTLPAAEYADNLILARKNIDVGTPELSAVVAYRPPRYRLLYLVPQAATAVHTLRRRQQSAAVGAAPRRRQIANRAGSIRRGPGAPR